MICSDFRDVVDSYLSDELLTETNHEMIRHMEACGNCRGVVEARREIRGMLKKAVIASPEFKIDENFNHNLMTRIRVESKKTNRGWFFGSLSVRSFAVAAGLLIVALLGYAFITNFRTAPSEKYLVSGFSEDSLLNIASGDHQQCAVEHELDQAPVSLESAGFGFNGLESVIKSELEPRLPDYELVESHACEFKNVKFAHFVMSGKGETLSVLIAPSGNDLGAVGERLKEFSSSAYRISSFGINKKAVFVISDVSRDSTRKAADALVKPLADHFSGTSNMQAAVLGKPPFHIINAGL